MFWIFSIEHANPSWVIRLIDPFFLLVLGKAKNHDEIIIWESLILIHQSANLSLFCAFRVLCVGFLSP